jgi:hypothetical protein
MNGARGMPRGLVSIFRVLDPDCLLAVSTVDVDDDDKDGGGADIFREGHMTGSK